MLSLVTGVPQPAIASLLVRRLTAAASGWQSAGWSMQQHCGFASAAGAAAAAGGAGDPQQALRQAFTYCVDQVKTHDYENFLWVNQITPKDLRAAVFALRAFNVETALIAGHAKSEMLVLMRCQWWKDAINDCYKGKPPQQPVVTALHAVLESGRALTRYRLQQIVSTREEDMLNHTQPASLAALERYAEGTAGQLLQLQLEAAGISASSTSSTSSTSSSSSSSGGKEAAAAAAAAEHAAAHLGKAVGICALLRGTYSHGLQRRVYLPADLCQQHGVSEEDVLAGRDSEGMRDVTLAVASAAKQHLDEARRLAPQVPPAARQLFAPAVGAGMYLGALEKAGFNLFDQRMLKGAYTPIAYQLQLKWALLRGQY